MKKLVFIPMLLLGLLAFSQQQVHLDEIISLANNYVLPTRQTNDAIDTIYCKVDPLSDTASWLNRRGLGLSYRSTNEKLTADEILNLVGPEQYRLYQKGHNQKIVATPLFSLAAVGCLDGVFWTGAWLVNNYQESHRQVDGDPQYVPMGWLVFPVLAGIGYGFAIVTGVPAILLNKSGNKKIDTVASNYNRTKDAPQLSMSVQLSGVGFSLTF